MNAEHWSDPENDAIVAVYLESIAGLSPSQTKCSDESQALQQFSTPLHSTPLHSPAPGVHRCILGRHTGLLATFKLDPNEVLQVSTDYPVQSGCEWRQSDHVR